MSQTIHNTAIINATNFTIGDNVSIGPYAVIEGENITIGNNVKISAHCYIAGSTKIGNNVSIFPFSSIGTPPQDLKYSGENSEVVIGNNTVIREHVTIHSGTKGGNMRTTVGANCLIMAASHIAHDCIIGENVIISHNAVLGGHVVVSDYANIGGLAAIHQHVIIGEHALIGGGSAVVRDVVPYGSVQGERAYLIGINITGIKRRGFSRKDMKAIIKAYDIIFYGHQDKLLSERIEIARQQFADNACVKQLIAFVSNNESKRHVCMPLKDEDSSVINI